MNPAFIKPRYDLGGFAGLPGAVRAIFRGGTPFEAFTREVDNLVLCFVDGFGWRQFEKFSGHPFLQHFSHGGMVRKLTSQFPSTTAAHVTCIHSGLNVGQSGIFEWYFYEPLLDAIIAPLLFSFSGTAERDTLKATGIDPKSIYPAGTIYQALAAQGVRSTVFQHREYTPSTYSDIMFAGATARGYKSLPETALNLSLALNSVQGKNYFFMYYDRIDSISHDYGPDSAQAEAELEMFLHVMQQHFMGRLRPAGRTLFLLTADHGQVDVDPATTFYLNRQVPAIEKFIRANRQGGLLVPGGSCRDMFLYIKDELLDEAQGLLASHLAGRADVLKTEELISAGYFGPDVSHAFRARVGNLVVLAYPGESVWWYEKGRFEQKFYGQHGGLTPQEMEIPLLGLEL